MNKILITNKICGSCNKQLPISEYHKQKSNKTGYQHYCKVCVISKIKDRYALKKDHVVKNNMSNNESIKDRNYAFVKRYLQRFGVCKDCGHKDIRVLEFDHVRGKKYKGVKHMCGLTASIQAIKEEIRKCEIRCCNCHRIKTAADLGWKRF